ncbi:hypothetical protein ABPG72_001795 [Tetrahymena utriculariae]
MYDLNMLKFSQDQTQKEVKYTILEESLFFNFCQIFKYNNYNNKYCCQTKLKHNQQNTAGWQEGSQQFQNIKSQKQFIFNSCICQRISIQYFHHQARILFNVSRTKNIKFDQIAFIILISIN